MIIQTFNRPKKAKKRFIATKMNAFFWSVNIHQLPVLSNVSLYPNPDIESQFRVRVIDVPKESTKTKYTLLVMKLFEDFLGTLRTCTVIVIFYIGIWVRLSLRD